jgi:glucose-6-phosphate isomerase
VTDGPGLQPPDPGLQASAGAVQVRVGPALAGPTRQVLRQLGQDAVAAKLARADASLWGHDAQQEAAHRLGWLRLPTTSQALLGPLEDAVAHLRHHQIDRVVLAGMGGSSLAPEVICAATGTELVTVDTTDPGQVAAAMIDLERTVLVVSSKSGSTLETDSHHRAFRAAFTAAGLEAARHIMVVTDPGSPLEMAATDHGVQAVFRADPDVGGRYSALTAFGLVPSALTGVDVAALLTQAQDVSGSLAAEDGPALLLGAALGAAAVAGRDKLVLADATGRLPGFADWTEQLVAESTGKQGRGMLPVVVSGTDAPGTAGPDRLPCLLGDADAPADGIAVEGPLGALFLVWEYATAVLGRLLQIDPFDQPNVQESKDNTNALLRDAGDGALPRSEPAFVAGPVQVFADPDLLAGASTVTAAMTGLLRQVPAGGYLAVMAYLDRLRDTTARGLRDVLAHRTAAAVTFGWGPRFLHSTGQYHKGGPARGAYLQITAEPEQYLDIPGRPFDFGELQRAQALGDQQALQGRGRPFLRLHLTDRAAGLETVLHAAEGAG